MVYCDCDSEKTEVAIIPSRTFLSVAQLAVAQQDMLVRERCDLEHMNSEKPYQSPRIDNSVRPERVKSPIAGCTLVGIIFVAHWAVAVGLMTDSIPFSFKVYTIGFGLTGCAVGVAKKMPLLLGPVSGVLSVSVRSAFLSPWDPWLLPIVVIGSVSGLVGGFIVGGLGMIVIHRVEAKKRRAALGSNGKHARETMKIGR